MPQIIISGIYGSILENGQPVKRVIDYIKAEGYPVALLTNRPESDRQKTVEDLKAAGLDYFRLIMNAGSAPAPEYKAKEVQGLLDEGFDGLLAVRLGTVRQQGDRVAFGLDVVDDALDGLAVFEDGAVDVRDDDLRHEIISFWRGPQGQGRCCYPPTWRRLPRRSPQGR